ncbi:hypothetical protein U0070_000013, partial [Myodes glareolus]
MLDHAATFEKPQAARAGSRPGQSPDSNNNAGRAAGINRKVKLGASTRAGRVVERSIGHCQSSDLCGSQRSSFRITNRQQAPSPTRIPSGEAPQRRLATAAGRKRGVSARRRPAPSPRHRPLAQTPSVAAAKMATAMYLEHYLDNKKAEIDILAAEYISTVKTLSSDQRVEHLQKIQNAYSKCKEYSDDKVQLAMQTYEMADLKDRMDGSDFESTGSRSLKSKLTDVLFAKGRSQKEKRSSRGRGRRTSEEDTPKKKKHKSGSEFTDSILSVHPSDVLDMPCPIEWFHFACVDLTTKPKGKCIGPDWGGEVVVLADLETEVYCSACLGVYSITVPPFEEGLLASSPVCTQHAPSVPGQCSTTGLCHLCPLAPGWIAVIFSDDEESRFLSPGENGDHGEHRKSARGQFESHLVKEGCMRCCKDFGQCTDNVLSPMCAGKEEEE